MTKVTTLVTRGAAVLIAAVVLGNATGAYAAGCFNSDLPPPSLSKTTTNSQDWDQHKINVKGFACNAK